MRHKTKGLRQSPAGLGVGRVALVKDGQGALKFRISEIKIKGGQLLRCQQALVDDRPRRKGAEINARITGLHLLTQAEQAQFQVRGVLTWGKETVTNCRQRLQGAWADDGRVGGNRTPAEKSQADGGGCLFHGNIRFNAPLGTKKHHAHAKLFRQIYAYPAGTIAEESLGDGCQQAGSVTAATVGVDTTPVSQPGQGRERPFHDLVGTRATELSDETYSARIMVGRKVVAILCHCPWSTVNGRQKYN